MNGGRGHFFLRPRAARGATVNNCTLNIDQGTVLGFTAFNYEWALRLNPGRRLNVNGVPTNRVVFARLEAVQEFPAGWPAGPYVTFKGVFLPTGTMVTPLPEARLHYADFPTLAGDATHFGPLTGDQTYDCVAALELNGCLLQGGTFFYEAGGPQGRTLNLHNTVFERSLVSIKSLLTLHGDNSETLTAANNLFYRCDMWLESLNSGSGWTFIDNLFDNAGFHGSGPAAVNSHSGYVNMSGSHLSPSTDTSPKDLTSLAYQTGPLGRFYLPTTATTLLGGGSRSAGAAGLFHFTSLTSNSKEAGNYASIGPAYVALNGSGMPVDSDGDAIPDYAEDENGDGAVEAGETDWAVKVGSKVLYQAVTDANTFGKSTSTGLVNPPWDSMDWRGYSRLKHNEYNWRNSWP